MSQSVIIAPHTRPGPTPQVKSSIPAACCSRVGTGQGGAAMDDIGGLRGEKIRLVPPDRTQHYDNALRWMNDPEVVRFLLNVTGVTPGMEEEWFTRAQKRDHEFSWAILDPDGRHIGFTAIHRIDWRLRAGRTRTRTGGERAPGQRGG